MGARGPHDDFETAAQLARDAYASFNETGQLSLDLISEDLEYVTRFGTFRGVERFRSEIEVQQDKWRLEFEIEEVIDAGEGAMILTVSARRLDRESGEVVWKAWPAVVTRVLDGKCVFFEGYVDRRKALADFGIEQG